MIRSLLHSRIRRLERSFGYDATYLHEVLDVSLPAFLKFALFQVMASHREQVPIDAAFAARIAATLSEDCGPCTQIVVDMALHSGMESQKIAALIRGDIEKAGADAALGFRFGNAVACNTADAPSISKEVERRFGKRALVSMSYAVACSRVYPALKRGLGHAAACTKIQVLDDSIIIRQAA